MVRLLPHHRSRHTVEMDTGKDWSEMNNGIDIMDAIKLTANYGEPLTLHQEECQILYDEIRKVLDSGKSLTAQKQAIIHEVQKYQPDGSPPPGDEAMLTRWIMSSLTASRDAWKRVALDATEKWVVDGEEEGKWECAFCRETATPFRSIDEPDTDENNGWECTHSPDCPIEQLRDLQRSER